jgi:hypothetical protein
LLYVALNFDEVYVNNFEILTTDVVNDVGEVRVICQEVIV